MKRILFFLCLLSASLTSTFADTTLSLDDGKKLTEWMASSCKEDTIFLTDAWTNWGWDYSTITGMSEPKDTTYTDFSGYDGYSGVEIKYKTNATSGYINLTAMYGYTYYDSGQGKDVNYTSSATTTFSLENPDTTVVYTLTFSFNEAYYDKMYQLYFSASNSNWTGNVETADSSTPYIVIESAKLISKDIQPIVNINNEAYIQTYWDEIQKWESVENDTIVPKVDEYKTPGATLTYTDTNGNGLGWGYYSSGYLDISAYKGIEVKYSVTGYTGTEPTVTLEMGSKTGSNDEHEITGVEGNDGIISFTFSSDSDFDPANVVKIVIKATAACTVTINYIKLVNTTIETESANFITTDESGNYLLNLDVTKTGGYWATVTTDETASTGDPITSAKITYKAANNLAGFEYASSDATSTHLNLKSYTPDEVDATPVEFSQMEVYYTISSTAARQSDRIRVMLELMDADGSYKNIEVYDNYCIGRLRVNFDDYADKINFENIQTITFLLESIPDGDQPVLNIDSIRVLTSDQVAAEKGQEHNLLISQLYTWQDIDGTSITPVTYDSETASWASEDTDISAKITTKTNWTAAAWWVSNVSEDEYWGVELKVKANQHCVVRLSIENLTGDYDEYGNQKTFVQCMSERGDNGSSDPENVHTLILPFLKKSASEYNKNLSYTPANSSSNSNDGEESSGNDGIEQTAETSETESDGSENLDGDVNEIYLLWGLINDSDDNAAGDEATIEIVSAKLLKAEAYSNDFVIITTSTDVGYGTYYNSEKAYRMPYGMSGTTVYGIGSIVNPQISDEGDGNEGDGNEGDTEDEEESVSYTTYSINAKWQFNGQDTFDGGDIVPKGTPLMVKGSQDDNTTLLYTAFVVNDSEVTDSITEINAKLTDGNLLHGSDNTFEASEMISITANDLSQNETATDDEISKAGEDYYYYKLAYMTYLEEKQRWGGDFGFFWGANDGVAFDMPAYNRAWLVLEKSQFSDGDDANGIKISGFTNDDESENVDGDDGEDSEDTTTGIAVAPATAVSNGIIYNLQGVRVNDMNRKGIYIVDGKKIVKQ